MPKRFVDARLNEAVALYLSLWPASSTEQARMMLRGAIQHFGIRDVMKRLKGELAKTKASSDEGVSTGEGNVS